MKANVCNFPFPLHGKIRYSPKHCLGHVRRCYLECRSVLDRRKSLGNRESKHAAGAVQLPFIASDMNYCCLWGEKFAMLSSSAFIVQTALERHVTPFDGLMAVYASCWSSIEKCVKINTAASFAMRAKTSSYGIYCFLKDLPCKVSCCKPQKLAM